MPRRKQTPSENAKVLFTRNLSRLKQLQSQSITVMELILNYQIERAVKGIKDPKSQKIVKRAPDSLAFACANSVLDRTGIGPEVIQRVTDGEGKPVQSRFVVEFVSPKKVE